MLSLMTTGSTILLPRERPFITIETCIGNVRFDTWMARVICLYDYKERSDAGAPSLTHSLTQSLTGSCTNANFPGALRAISAISFNDRRRDRLQRIKARRGRGLEKPYDNRNDLLIKVIQVELPYRASVLEVSYTIMMTSLYDLPCRL